MWNHVYLYNFQSALILIMTVTVRVKGCAWTKSRDCKSEVNLMLPLLFTNSPSAGTRPKAYIEWPWFSDPETAWHKKQTQFCCDNHSTVKEVNKVASSSMNIETLWKEKKQRRRSAPCLGPRSFRWIGLEVNWKIVLFNQQISESHWK